MAETPTENPAPAGAGRRLPRLPSWVVLPAVLVGFALVARGHWRSYVETLQSTDVLLMAAATLVLPIGHVLNALLASLLMQRSGQAISTRDAFSLSNVSGLAKYIPGGVWQVGSQLELGRSIGLSYRSSIRLFFEPLWFQLSASIGLGLLAAAATPFFVPGPLLILLALVSLAFSHHNIRDRVMRVLRIEKRTATTESVPSWLAALAIACAGTAILGVHGYLVASALGFETPPTFAGVFAAILLGWAIGFLVFPVPGGLGVREAVTTLLLAPWLAAPQALLVATLSRVVSVVAELASALVGALLWSLRREASVAQPETESLKSGGNP